MLIFYFLRYQLYNVVVDTEKTGKLLLENGQLQRKVTLIPLNNIAARSINEDVVNKAKTIVWIFCTTYIDCHNIFVTTFIVLNFQNVLYNIFCVKFEIEILLVAMQQSILKICESLFFYANRLVKKMFIQPYP